MHGPQRIHRSGQILVGLLLALMVLATPAKAVDLRHADWSALLKQHVQWNAEGTASQVDYAGLARDRAKLKAYLGELSAQDKAAFEAWPEADRQAFLLNAYNAFTVELILTRYPDLASIKDLGGLFSSPWKQTFFSLLGEERSLDDVEHGLLRGAPGFREPRIHFAANCASVGCPALRPEAYVGATLNAQLQDQAERFLRDRSRNRWDPDTGKLSVSKIFDWYADDFGADSIKPFLAGFADQLGDDEVQRARIRDQNYELDYGDYDWSLNRSP